MASKLSSCTATFQLISIDHHLFQYVETNLSKKLFVFGKSPSEAAYPDKHTRRAAHVSQPAPFDGDPLSLLLLAAVSLYAS